MKYKNKMIPITWAGVTFWLFLCFILSIPGKAGADASNTVTIGSLMDGSCQAGVQKWFDENFFGRDFITKCYNQFKYSVIHEGTNGWMIGKDGFLFSVDQTETWALGENSASEPNAFEAYAKDIHILQESLNKYGKDFIFLLNPVKAEICTEYLPSRYRFLADRYYYGADEAGNKKLLIAALEKYGVNYMDMTKDIRQLWESGETRAFYSTGHHWSIDAAVESVNAVFDRLRDTTQLSVPHVIVHGKTDDVFDKDLDLYALQNIFKGRKDRTYHTPLISYDFTSENHVFMFTTSFGWELVEALYRNEGNKAFQQLVFHEYFTNRQILNGEKISWDAFVQGQNKSELNLIPEIQDSDLIILLQDAALGVYPTHKEFVEYVNANIDHLYYKLGENMIDNNADAAGVRFENFYDLEDWGRWSKGTDCSVSVYTNETSEPMENDRILRVQASSCMEDHSCTIKVNGNPIGNIRLKAQACQNYTLDIPLKYLDQTKNTISFHLDGPFCSPYEAGAGDDNRSLGIGFISLTLEDK